MIVKAPEGRWCDYCKSQWGKIKGDWHPRAKTQAVVLCISETHLGENNERAYCLDHRAELSTWHDGTVWSLADQMAEGRRLMMEYRARKAREAAEAAVNNV